MTGFEHCQFFVERKKRYCRMSVKKGRSYCGEHQIVGGELPPSVVDERIPCPLDPTHTIFKSKLSKHLKVCNAKVKLDSQPSYVVKGINLGQIVTCGNDKPLSEIDQSIVDAVLNKINISYDRLPGLQEEVLKHESLEKELNDSKYGAEGKRHLVQTASLLGHLATADLIQDNTCYIEFGAGRGKLTYWLGQAIKGKANSSILLVDRSSHRHKRDNKLKDEQSEIKVVRVRADIADLKLSDVPEIQEKENRVAIAKHICGAATDLTLRCMTNSITEDFDGQIGIVIAFCCHHQCEYSHYVGQEYLEKEGFSKDEFPILCKIASWATCGIKLNNARDDSKRDMIGRKVKILLNQGRLEYLKTFGFDGRLLNYTDTDTTLENVCIVAKLTRESSADKAE